MNTTKEQKLQPITKRAYKMLANKVSRWETFATNAGIELSVVAKENKAKLEAYSMPCPGFAHTPDGFWQDNCMVCAPQWGQVQKPELTK